MSSGFQFGLRLFAHEERTGKDNQNADGDSGIGNVENQEGAKRAEMPLKNLRPAQDTCEKCHWPEKVHGNIDITFDHYLSDKKNTPYSVRMLMLVNTGRPGGPLGGIHWHVNPENKVEYYATDPKRQDIPWMRVTDTKTGSVQVFRTEEFTGEPPANLIRRMDCIDCHNRPAHTFPAANDSVERAMASGTISTKLPNIKRVAVQAMTQPEITGDAQAPQKIAEFLRAKYPETPELTATIAEVQKIHATSIFLDRQADWRAYPDNLGHKNWNGCFRCHGEKHKSDTGRTVRASDCNSCHTIIAQGTGVSLSQLNGGGLEFKHPDGELDPSLSCVDCHNGGNQGK